MRESRIRSDFLYEFFYVICNALVRDQGFSAQIPVWWDDIDECTYRKELSAI